MPAASLLLMLPPAVNLAGGLTWIWTPSLPLPLLHLLTRAGLLDGWLVLDLLAASGVLGGAALAALAARERTATVVLLAGVSAISLAAAVIGGAWLPTWYGVAYGGALVILRKPRVSARATSQAYVSLRSLCERFTGRT